MALLAGLFYSLQLLQHWPLPKIAVLSPGRIRMIHTNMIAFGFLTNGFLAMLYWTVPRLTGKRVTANSLGWLILVAWNAIVALTYVGLHLGRGPGDRVGRDADLGRSAGRRRRDPRLDPVLQADRDLAPKKRSTSRSGTSAPASSGSA